MAKLRPKGWDVTRKKVRGFSLLESLVSLFIMVLSALTVFAVGSLASKVGRQGEARSVAMSIARQQIETLLEVSQANRKIVTNKTFTIPSDLINQFPNGTTAGLRGTYTIEALGGSKNLEQITVTVKWRNSTGHAGSEPLSMVTLSKIAASSVDLGDTWHDGINEEDEGQLFYIEPPYVPPSDTTGDSDSSSTSSDGEYDAGDSGSSSSSGDGGSTDAGYDAGTSDTSNSTSTGSGSTSTDGSSSDGSSGIGGGDTGGTSTSGGGGADYGGDYGGHYG